MPGDVASPQWCDMGLVVRVSVCQYRCGYAADVLGFCEWCGGACKEVSPSELTLGEALCRLGVAIREFMAHVQRQRDDAIAALLAPDQHEGRQG